MSETQRSGGHWSGESWNTPQSDHTFAPRGKAFANRTRGAHNQPVTPFNEQPHDRRGAGVIESVVRAVRRWRTRSTV
ncbi:hypothetical protein ACPYO6_10510 [Georgenia sp. Z1344]|uniref:hypothetical protein n=1 Tax=Georgenia sp. Z1344 TaxID=3416706 RepID=UPI003CF88396